MITRRSTAAALALALATIGALTGIAAPTAAAEGSAVIDLLNPLINAGAATGSGQAFLTGSNAAATDTGSAQLAGILLCGLITMSDADGYTICNTSPVG